MYAIKLRLARRRSKLTIDQLSAVSGVCRNTIIAIEGGRDTKVSTLFCLAETLGLNPGSLIGLQKTEDIVLIARQEGVELNDLLPDEEFREIYCR